MSSFTTNYAQQGSPKSTTNFSINYANVQPEAISIQLGKELQMPNTKTGGTISYKQGDLMYTNNNSKHKLLVNGPECKSKSGLYLNKDDEDVQQPQSYNQPMIGGYQNQQMFNPSSIAPKKFKKKISSSVPVELQPNSDENHRLFVDKLNAINTIVNSKLFEIKNLVYMPQAISGQQITNKSLVSYPVNNTNSLADLEANPTIWLQVKKYEDQMNKVFYMPNGSFLSYKDLIGVSITGIPLFSFVMFFNQGNRTCKLNLEGFVITNIEVSAVNRELSSIAEGINQQDPELAGRLTEVLKTINDNKVKNKEPECEELPQVPSTITDIPVVLPQSVVNQQSYTVPQTPQTFQQPFQQQFQQPFQQQFQQQTPHSYLK